MMIRKVKYDERASIYDAEYTNNDDHDMLSYYVSKAKKILEIPCGSGRNIDIYQKADGFATLVDIEPNMVKLVKEKVNGNRNIKCLVGDILDLDIDDQFDLIIVPKEAFQMFISRWDAKRVLNQLREHLLDKGILYIDVFEYGKQPQYGTSPLYYEYENINKDFKLNWVRGHLSRWSKLIYQDRVLKVTYKYFSSNTHSIFYSDIQMRDYSYEEFNILCHECKLEVQYVYGAYDFTDYDNSCNRMIFILTSS